MYVIIGLYLIATAQIVVPNIVTATNIVILAIVFSTLKINVKVASLAIFVILLGMTRNLLYQEIDMMSVMLAMFILIKSRYQNYLESKFVLSGNHTLLIYAIQTIAIFIALTNYFQQGSVAFNTDTSHNHTTTLFLSLYILSLTFETVKIECSERGVKKRFKRHYGDLLNVIAILIMMTLTGRTGLIIAIGILLYEVRRRNIYAQILTFISTIFAYFNYELVLNYVMMLNGGIVKFATESVASDVRNDVMLDWIERLMNIQNWSGFSNGYFVGKFGIGPHNGYIQIQSAMGVIGLFLFLTLNMVVMLRAIFAKKYELAFLLLLLLTRMYTDTVSNAAVVLLAFLHLYLQAEIKSLRHKWV